MGENLHDIDKLFKNSIDNYEESPPESLWNAIDNNLDKNNVVAIKKKYDNLKMIAASLLLLLLGTITWHVINNRSIESGDTAAERKSENAANELSNDQVNSKKINDKNVSGSDGTNNGRDSTKVGDSQFKSKATSTNSVGKNGADDKSFRRGAVNFSAYAAIAKSGHSINKSINREGKSFEPKNKKRKESTENEITETAILSSESINNNRDINTKANRSGQKILLKDPVADDDQIFYSKHFAANENVVSERTAIDATSIRVNDLIINDDKRMNEKVVSNSIAINNKKAKPHRFSVMAFYSPHISFNRIVDDEHDGRPPRDHERDEIERGEQNQKAYSFGVHVTIPVDKKWSLQTGASYSVKKIAIDPKQIFARLDNDDGKVKYRFDCSSGYTYLSPKSGSLPSIGDSAAVTASSNSLQYLRIPIAINYKFGNGKFSVIPSVGAGVNFLIKQEIETELLDGVSKEKQQISNIQGLKSAYFHAITGVALEYNINRQVALDIIPAANFALSAINKNATVKSYPNSFELAAGIKINF